jgi:hypothetical protein
MINRAVLILKYKESALQWVNQSEPDDERISMTLDDVNRENTAYLISEEDSESPDTLNIWLELNYERLFESELENWYTDETLWPQERTFKLFQQWFNFDCHTIVIDTVPTPIVDEEDIDTTSH